MLERAKLQQRSGSPGLALVDPAFAKRHPMTWDYLTQATWEDGTVREVSTVMIIPEGGCVKIMLRDRAMGVCCWVASPTLTGFWEVLEAALRDPQHEWRTDRQVAPTARRVGRNGHPLDKGGR
jgi:hypothetical protein